MRDVVEAVRSGRGPVIVEATTYRGHGHYEGDPERYRTPDEVRAWEARDPLVMHAQRLHSSGVADEAIAALESSVARELDDAVDAARRLDPPPVETLTRYVVRARPQHDVDRCENQVNQQVGQRD